MPRKQTQNIDEINEIQEDVNASVEPVIIEEEFEPKEVSLSSLAGSIKEEAFKTKVVTVISNDARDAGMTTAIVASCENQFFSLAKIVPLNTPVELEQCLIDTLKDIQIPVHLDEVINGQRTGNSTFTLVKKYNINEA